MSSGLPESVRIEVEARLATLDMPASIRQASAVPGGCIHHGMRLDVGSDAAYFLKWNSAPPSGMFEAEADGLRALRATQALVVPEPLAWSDGPPGWLLMEYVEPGTAPSGAQLGRALARIHGTPGPAPRDFGWSRDNWIGSLPQANPQHATWGTFWRDARLAPQLERARQAGRLHDARFDRVLDVTAAALAHVTDPELLHGDLWSGNAFTSRSGAPVLVDPAVYRGDGEVDVAMSELFGGFDRDFYAAYATARPLTDEYDAYARDLYQLYSLLVHVNLFGGTYEAGARRAADGVLQAL